MIQKKICMLGAFAVGKTTLVQRFVTSIFTDKYLTTVGVKIDKKQLKVGDTDVNLLLWDLAGEDEFQKVQLSYLRGAAGYLLVVDGTRQSSLDSAFLIQRRVEREVGEIPFIAVFNKVDLQDEWEIADASIADLEERGWNVIKSSAKTGQGVEEAFHALAEHVLRT
ncbi:MAG: GTP-binding protein [Deltaproteobacteria bacterium]|nr:GTP-binding protein [Deltaproteobacteria bacterium]